MTLQRKTPMPRGKGLERTGSLKRTGRIATRTDPVYWQRRTAKAIRPFSTKRQDKREERRELVYVVLTEEADCQAAIRNVCTRGGSTEVNELKRRGQWAAGYLIRWNTEGLCYACHHFITEHPGAEGWAVRHGHQVSGEAGLGAYLCAAVARQYGRGCPTNCPLDHRPPKELTMPDALAPDPRTCSCGTAHYPTGDLSIPRLFSKAWHQYHRVRHLETFPDLDPISRSNLDNFIEWAPV